MTHTHVPLVCMSRYARTNTNPSRFGIECVTGDAAAANQPVGCCRMQFLPTNAGDATVCGEVEKKCEGPLHVVKPGAPGTCTPPPKPAGAHQGLTILTGHPHIPVEAVGGCADGAYRFAGAPNPGATGAAGSTPSHHGDNLGVGLRHLRLLRNNGAETRTKGVIQECRGNSWWRVARSRDHNVATELCNRILAGNPTTGQVCGRAYEDEM